MSEITLIAIIIENNKKRKNKYEYNFIAGLIIEIRYHYLK